MLNHVRSQGEQPKTDGPADASLLTRTAHLSAILSELEGRLSKVGDDLFGPEPRPVENGKAENVPSVDRNISWCGEIATRISNAVARLEARI